MSMSKLSGRSSNGSKRQSMTNSNDQPNPFQMMWPMSQMFNPFMVNASAASAAGKQPKNEKPWEVSDSESEEDDFQPSKKRRLSSKPKTSGAKRGPGRPKKADQAEKLPQTSQSSILAKYPPAIYMKDEIAYLQQGECPSCGINKGKIAFFPCGHCMYCFTCTNKLRTEALKLGRPAKCPADECFVLVDGWVQLYNVSG